MSAAIGGVLHQDTAFTDIVIAGDKDVIKQAISTSSLPYYVYIILRNDGVAFYVGKGTALRVFQHETEAINTSKISHKLNVIRSVLRSGHPINYAIAGFFEHETDAHACERGLILRIGRHDLNAGPLTNQTDGGEGTSNPSAESRARRAATLGGEAEDPDRRLANRFFQEIAGQQESVPIKPLGTRRLEFTTPPPEPRKPKQRMAVTLVAAALAIDSLLETGSVLRRTFPIEGRLYVIENGVARDMLKAGMITIESGANQPENEKFVVTKTGMEAIIEIVGRDKLVDLGVIAPP